MTTLPTRRTTLRLLASAPAGAALPLARGAPAAAQFGPSPFGSPGAGLPLGLRIGAVLIDTDRIARLGNPDGAELLERDLSRQVHAVFGDRLASRGAGGATLAVRITSLYLPPWAGGRRGGNGGEGPDSIEGVGSVTLGGRTLSETPVLATLPPSYSGTWHDPDIDRRRAASISHQFAYWLRREMGI